MVASRLRFLDCRILTIKLSGGRPTAKPWTISTGAAVFLTSGEAPDGSAPIQVTNFTEDAIFYFDWDDEGQLIAARGAKIRDIVVIRNFE